MNKLTDEDALRTETAVRALGICVTFVALSILSQDRPRCYSEAKLCPRDGTTAPLHYSAFHLKGKSLKLLNLWQNFLAGQMSEI